MFFKMSEKLEIAIGGLVSNIYQHKSEKPSQSVVVGTPIPWLGDLIWAGDVDSFKTWCTEYGEPDVRIDAGGMVPYNGNWLGESHIKHPCYLSRANALDWQQPIIKMGNMLHEGFHVEVGKRETMRIKEPNHQADVQCRDEVLSN